MEILEWSDERNEIAGALFAITNAIDNPKAGRKGQEGHQEYKYANLNDFLGAVKGACKDNDVLLTQGAGGDSEAVIVETVLTHIKSGQWVRSRMAGTPHSRGLKGHGTCISYLRRYALQPMFSLFAEDDTDANSTPESRPKAGAPRATGSTPPSGGAPRSAKGAPATSSGKCSENQRKLIYRLVDERDWERPLVQEYMLEKFGVSGTTDLAFKDASTLIDDMMKGKLADWMQGGGPPDDLPDDPGAEPNPDSDLG